MNILLQLQYIGTNYSGWQIQKNGKSIQEAVEQGIYKMTQEKVSLIGSGRTDAGVHALGQIANFHTRSSIPPEKWALALGSYLPDDIVALRSMSVKDSFHSRFDALDKTYIYRLYHGEVHPVFERKRSAFIRERLDVFAMQKALQDFIGTHDYKAFCAAGSSVQSTIRTVHSASLTTGKIQDSGGELSELKINGNGFLYNMVRILAGTLIEIGKGKDYSISQSLRTGKREDAGPTAPPWGLYLFEVKYTGISLDFLCDIKDSSDYKA